MSALRPALLLVMLTAVITSGFNGIRIAPYATLSDGAFVLLVAAWILSFPLQRHAKPRWSVIWSLLLFILAFLALFVAGASARGAAADLVGLAKILTTFFVLPYLIADVAKTDRHARAVVVAFVASAVVNVVVSLFDATGLTDFQNWMGVETIDGWAYETRFHGLAMHPNHFGQMCAIAALLALAVFPASHYRWKRVVWAASEALLVIGIVGSGSRAALVAAVVVALLLSLKYRRVLAQSLSKFILFGGMAAVSIAASFYLSEITTTHGAVARLLASSPDLGVEQSNSARIVSYKNAVEDITASPIIGMGFSHLGGVENLLLQFLQSAGVIGLVGLGLYFYPVGKAWANLKGRRLDLLMAAVVGGAGVYLVFTQMVNLTYARFSLIPLGLLWSLQRRSRVANTGKERHRLRERALVLPPNSGRRWSGAKSGPGNCPSPIEASSS